MKIGETIVENTFAEAFGMQFTRLVVTALDEYWLAAAVGEMTGYSASVIACDAETGVERYLVADETPDGRVGAAILAFGFSRDALGSAIRNRTGQCVMTCPTTAAYDGLPESDNRLDLGKKLRFFGDGFQKSKVVGGVRYWRVPVMDGEFLVQESLGSAKGVAGGNVILQAVDQTAGLIAVRRAVAAVADLPGVITPFPGGVARSGSKVGSRYKGLVASTADAYCPTLRGRTESKLLDGVHCVYEIVMDGVDEASVGRAMAVATRAAAGKGILTIGAGNYGGELGKHHLYLHEWLDKSS